MVKLNRYSLATRDKSHVEDLTLDPKGEWVAYDDVQKELARLNSEIARLRSLEINSSWTNNPDRMGQ